MSLKPESRHSDEIRKIAVHNCCFSFLNIGLMLFSDSKARLETFKLLYQNFTVRALSGDYITCYLLTRTSFCDCPCVIVDTVVYPLTDECDVVSSSEMIIFRKIIDCIDSHLLLHAGVVSRDGRGYIICAPSGFGKTTMVMELVSRGYKFLSDEYCPIGIGDCNISPFPRRVGLKDNSPFLRLTDVDRSVFMEHENKYFADCNEVFPGSLGKECMPGYLIMLSADSFNPVLTDENIIVMGVFNENKSLMAELENIDVKVIDKSVKGFYLACRLDIPKQGALTGKFNKLWKKYKRDIFYVAAIPEKQPGFTRIPFVEPLAKSRASLEILACLINRSPAGKLLMRYDGKSISMFLEAGKLVKNIECYKMTPGNLGAMVDLIDKL